MKSGKDNRESATLSLFLMTKDGASRFFIINQTLIYSFEITIPQLCRYIVLNHC